jgi:protein TonB
MRRGAEILAFLGLSTVVHAGVMIGFDQGMTGGPQGQGAGGADRVTLTAAPDQVAALVDHWTRAPATAVPTPLPMPLAEDAVDVRISAETAVSSLSRPVAPARQTASPLPQIEHGSPAVVPFPVVRTAPVTPGLPQPTVNDTTAGSGRDQVLVRSAPPVLTAPPVPAAPAFDRNAPPAPETLARDTSPRPMVRPARAAPSQASAARVASGSGGGASLGGAPAQSVAAPAPSPGAQQSLMSQWGGRILARIERARPQVQGAGQVVLALRIARTGQLAGVSVSQSSGNPALDQAAVTAVQRAGRFPEAPEGLTDASYGFSLPIRFR